ncbi:hypothetical protein RclHR1_01610021 [Rhizophagus clarus]|uniref:Uncharacterized protein n=1 Tax=Rhizophagus clarus TaxID=94130 RepID=A0A2Z6QGX4_9GLOM|nr:hypothetical protein RclHR1_01610021 [Rhizophagus clarus]GES98069.1 hypothetical protein GLOIN_2v1880782 [Rhizophagus clarus]
MSTNNFSHIYESNLQTTATETYDIYTPSNNVDYSISDHITDHNQQQPNIASPNHNHQQQYQYTQQPDTSNNHNYQQPMTNVDVTTSSDNNQPSPNSTLHRSNQQSTSNNESSSQFYHDQNQHNPQQSNILPLLDRFGINIHYPQAPIIIMPTTNSDIQTQLQQVLAILNHSSSTKTQ